MTTPTRGQQRQIADYLDHIADQKLNCSQLGSADPMTANRISLGAAYRLVAAEMRALAESEG